MIELIIALGAGLISFLSPCVLPLIPGYISYISGSSLNELIEKKNVNIFPIILFTVGFSIVFIIFGAASTFLGKVLLQNSYQLRIVAGLIIIILSLHIIGIFNIKFLNYEKRIEANVGRNFFSPFLIVLVELATDINFAVLSLLLPLSIGAALLSLVKTKKSKIHMKATSDK